MPWDLPGPRRILCNHLNANAASRLHVKFSLHTGHNLRIVDGPRPVTKQAPLSRCCCDTGIRHIVIAQLSVRMLFQGERSMACCCRWVLVVSNPDGLAADQGHEGAGVVGCCNVYPCAHVCTRAYGDPIYFPAHCHQLDRVRAELLNCVSCRPLKLAWIAVMMLRHMLCSEPWLAVKPPLSLGAKTKAPDGCLCLLFKSMLTQ